MIIDGNKLRIERSKKGINQDTLAEGVGLSQAMISLVERGARNIPWMTVSSICEFIGCKIEDVTENREPSPIEAVKRDICRLSQRKQEMVAMLVKELLR